MISTEKPVGIDGLEQMIRRIRSQSGCIRVLPILEESLPKESNSIRKAELLTELIAKIQSFGGEDLLESPPFPAGVHSMLRCYITALTFRSGEYTAGAHNLSAGEADARLAIELSQKIDDDVLYSTALNHLGNNLIIQQRTEEARQAFIKGLELDRSGGNAEGLVRSLYNFAQVELSLGNHQAALDSVNEALLMYKNDSEATLPPFGEALLLTIRLDIHEYYNNPRQALLDALHCLRLFETLGMTDKLASMHFHLVRLYLHVEDVGSAIEHAQQMVPEGQHNGNLTDRLYQLAAHTATHIQLNELSKASDYCNEALSLIEQSGQSMPVETILLERSAEIARLQGKLDKAEAILNEAISKERHATKRAMQCAALASLFIERDRYNEAESVLNDGLRSYTDFHPRKKIGFLLLVQARLAKARGHYQQAMRLCYDISTAENEPLSIRIEAIEYLSTLYELQGNYHEALHYSRQHCLLALQRAQKLTETRLTVLRSQLDIKQLQKEVQKVQENNRQEQVEVKKLSLELVEKQSMLQEIQGNIQVALKSFAEGDHRKGTSILQTLVGALHSQPVIGAELMSYLQRIDENFLIRLRKKYPAVTSSQERLSGLIHIGLSSAEIARILHVSPETVLTQRKRLRKKLDLQKSDSLEHTLLAL